MSTGDSSIGLTVELVSETIALQLFFTCQFTKLSTANIDLRFQ